MSSAVTILQSERLKYPGLLPREVLILQSWLKLHEKDFDRFDYNFRVGEGTDPGPTWPDYIRQQAIQNSQKRIDVVAWKGDQATVAEVKDRAGFAAVGQLVGYRPLFVARFPDKPRPLLLLITNVVNNDILPVLGEMGIRLDVVEADFGVLKTR